MARVGPWAVVLAVAVALMCAAHVGSVRECRAAVAAGTYAGGC